MQMIDEIRHFHLDRLIEKEGSAEAVARKANISGAYLRQIRMGYRNMGPATARKIEKAFGLEKGYLDVKHPEAAIGASTVDGHVEKRVFNRRVDDLVRSNVTEGPEIRASVPLISWVQAGDFCEAVDTFPPGCADEWIPVTMNVGPHAYALRVQGDSMEPQCPAGTVLIVEPERAPVSGNYVIAKDGGDCTFKQFIKDGADWYLKPLNDRYPIKPFTDGMSICGVVVLMQRAMV